MKKLFVLLMSATLLLSLAACSNANDDNTASTNSIAAETEPETPTEADDVNSIPDLNDSSTEDAEGNPLPEDGDDASVEDEEDTTAEDGEDADQEGDESPEDEGNAVTDGSESDSAALAILNTVWDSYGEDELFPVVGGDLTEEHVTPDAPGIYGLDEPDIMDNALGFPAAFVDKIDDAASMIHMMNANTFTCGVYHVTDTADMDDITAAIQDNILNRHFMCGFPEKLVIYTVDDCIVAVFGHNEPVDTFIEKLTAANASAEFVCDEAI